MWRCGRGEDIARLPEPRVDAMRFAKVTDRCDARGDRLAGAHRRFGAIESHQPVELIPPSARKPAVAPAWPTATDVLFQDRDPEVGIGFGEKERCPQAGESASDDHDVRVDVLVERRAITARLSRPRFTEPPAALCAGRQRIAGEVEG